MTAEREAQLRASENLGYKMAREVFDELDATRADLAELVAALPVCQGYDANGKRCLARATVGSLTHEPERCDEHRRSWDTRECDWAAVLRRLAREGGGK